MPEEEELEVEEVKEVVPTITYSQVFRAKVDDLKQHPIARQIYGYRMTKGTKFLTQLFLMVGQLEPIIINSKNEILSGNRRWQAAMHLGWETMDAIMINATASEEQNIVFHNQHRVKKTDEIIREAEAILGLLGKNQGVRKDLLGDDPLKFGKIGQDRFEIAAKVIGNISGTSLRRMMAVVDFENEAPENKNLGLVESIINNNLSPHRAYTMMKDVITEREERKQRKK
jgi:hypothetical protein